MEDLTIDSALEKAETDIRRINESVLPQFDDPDEDEEEDEE